MNTKHISIKTTLIAAITGFSLMLSGCGGQSETKSSADDVAAFRGHDSPEAQAAAQKAAASDAAKSAQARAADQGKQAPAKP